MAPGPDRRSLAVAARQAAGVFRAGIESRWCASIYPLIWLAPASIFLTLNSYANATPAPDWTAMLASAVASVFVPLVFMGVAAKTVLRTRFERPQRLGVVLTVFALAGASRSLAGATVFSIVAPEHSYYHLFPAYVVLGAVHGVVWLSLVATVLNLISTQRRQQRKLAANQAALTEVAATAVASLRQDIATVQEMINDRLLPVMERVKARIATLSRTSASTDLLTAAGELQEVCNSEVRAMSHRLSEPLGFELETEAELPQRGWGSLVVTSFAEARPHFALTLGVTAYMGVSLAIPRLGLWQALQIFFVMVPTALSALAIDRLWFARQSAVRGRHIFAAYALLTVVTAVSVQLNPGFEGNQRLQNLMTLDIPIAFFIAWSMFVLLDGAVRGNAALTEELRQAAQELANKVVELNLERNRARRVLATLLHGPIQGRLSAVALALTAQAEGTAGDDELLRRAKAQLAEVDAQLQDLLHAEGPEALQDRPVASDLKTRMAAAAAEWHGLVAVELALEPGAVAAAGNRGLEADIENALRECLLNSARHGRARQAWVELVLLPGAGDLQLLVRDDGRPEARLPLSEGLGGREIRAQGATRLIEQASDGTRVSITWLQKPVLVG